MKTLLMISMTAAIAFAQGAQEEAGTAANIQNTIVWFRPDILLHKHPAAMIGTDQRVIELVKERAIQDRSNVFNHIGRSLSSSWCQRLRTGRREAILLAGAPVDGRPAGKAALENKGNNLAHGR